MMTVLEPVDLASIRLEGSTQARVRMCPNAIRDYSAAMEESLDRNPQEWGFPKVVLYWEEATGAIWIGDGFHRITAAHACGLDALQPGWVEMVPGDRLDALRFALQANARHGLARSIEDKRRAVELALGEWPMMSSRSVAGLCAVSHVFVESVRRDLGAQRDRVMGADGVVQAVGAKRHGGASQLIDKTRNGGNVTTGGEYFGDSGDEEEGVDGAGADPDDGEDGYRSLLVWARWDEEVNVAEVQPWVPHSIDGTGSTTWGSIAAELDLEAEDGWFRRNVVKAAAAQPAPGTDVDEYGYLARTEAEKAAGVERRRPEPRWGGFRKTIISVEHAVRERERIRKEKERADNVLWTRRLVDGLEEDLGGRRLLEVLPVLAGVLAQQVYKIATHEGRALLAAVCRAEAESVEERMMRREGSLVEALVLLLEPELDVRGADFMEVDVMPEWFKQEGGR